MEKEKVLNIPGVCVGIPANRAGEAHAPCYIAICGLCDPTAFIHVV
jgi:hypothetical protein